MDFLLLLKILLEWSFKSKEYKIIHFIYTNFNIGIPNSFLYLLEDKSKFNSLNNFFNENESKLCEDIYLRQLIIKLKKSKYKVLEEWNNKYGYKYF